MVDLFGKAATGGSYFNKYLIGEDGCISVCVCVLWWVLVICAALSVCISMKSHLKGVLNEGDDHFLTPSPKWGNLIFFFSASFSPSHLLSSSLPLFHPISQSIPVKAE